MTGRVCLQEKKTTYKCHTLVDDDDDDDGGCGGGGGG